MAYNEVSGDPPAFDTAGGILSGDKASYGNISMQISLAADLLRYDPGNLSGYQRSEIKSSLQDNVQNIFLSARYLSQGRDAIAPGRGAGSFTTTDKKNVDAWYKGGAGYWATDPGARSYGGNIVKNQGMLSGLLG